VERSPLLLVIEPGAEVTPGHFAPLEVVRCTRCNHLYNRAYDPDNWELMYRCDILTNRPVHVTMSRYLEEVADWIGRERIRGANVVEVGAGSGHLARVLARDARSVLVFEPSRGLAAQMLPETNIELLNEPFSASSVSPPVDLIVCRQVLEHLADPLTLLGEMRKALSKDGAIYLEVPAAEFIEDNAVFCELHNAHVQYFHRSGLEALGRRAGLEIVRERSVKGGHDRGVLFRHGDGRGAIEFKSGGEDTLAARLSQRFDSLRSALLRGEKSLILYGATWQAVGLLGPMGASPPVRIVLDDNDDYAGRLMYNTDQKAQVVYGPTAQLSPDDAVLITAYLHKRVIAERLRETGFTGQIESLA